MKPTSCIAALLPIEPGNRHYERVQQSIEHVDNSNLNLAIVRHGEQVSVRVVRREGQLRVSAIHT